MSSRLAVSGLTRAGLARAGLTPARLAAGIALVLAALAWLGFDEQPAQPGTTTIASPARPQAEPALSPGPQAPGADAPLAAADARAGTPRPRPGADGAAAADAPPGMSPEQWQRVSTELAARPDGPAELARLRAYLVYVDTLQRFRQLRGQGSGSPELTALATTLDAGLPERQRQRELHGAEAYQIKRAVLEVLEPDPAARQQRLAAWQAEQTGPATASASDPRDREFLRQQQALIAAWSAQPEGLRDRAQLERDLQALRLRVYQPTGS